MCRPVPRVMTESVPSPGWRRLRGVLVVLGLGLLGGCATVGPDYQPPEVDWLADWQPDLYGQQAQADDGTGDDLRFWWQLFNDPVLTVLIAEARRENPSLRLAGLRILESRATLGIADSGRYPQLQQIGADATYIHEEQAGGANRDRSFARYSADFSVGWELDFWGRFRRGIESADAAFFASIANQQDAQVLLVAQVVDFYYAYCTTLQRIGIARHNAAIQHRSFEITERIFKAGQGSELDLQQARTQYLATRATIPLLQADLIRLRNALAGLLGRPPGPIPELEATKGELPPVRPMAIEAVPAQLLLRRPDVRSAAWQVAAQSAQIGVAEADYYPAISLFGSIGWSTSTLSNSGSSTSLLAGPALSWNLFDYGRIRNNVRLQDARLQSAIAAFQGQVLGAARELDDAAVQVVKTVESQQSLTESVEAAQRALDLATKRYQEGYSDFQRVLDAQRILFAQAERELVNHGAHVSAIVDLYRAAGGGWMPMSMDRMLPADIRQTMEERTDWGNILDEPVPEVRYPAGSAAPSPSTP